MHSLARSRFFLLFTLALLLWTHPVRAIGGPDSPIPEPLKIWEDWATWNDADKTSPTNCFSADQPLRFWPSHLNLAVTATGGNFQIELSVFTETWVPLPGENNLWPTQVKVDGGIVPVVEHEGVPAIRLLPGLRRVEGNFHWTEIPPTLKIPAEIGILTLTVAGKTIEAPTWNESGHLALQRNRPSAEASKDYLGTRLYSVLEDGIPLQLHLQVELTVSGKSREEIIGNILPEGWKLAAVNSPIPVAVDETGKLKAQVRAGKWTIAVEAFQLKNTARIGYAPGAKPAVAEQLIAFRPKPELRLVEVRGVPSIDVSQTTFPEMWRQLAVYRWETATPFELVERMRGMGLQKPEGLQITRNLWLDDSGAGLTYRDSIAGNSQQIWRLDAAPGQDPGSVRQAGEGQLITRNPGNGAPGFEVRSRNLNFEATGRIENARRFFATGWRADADKLSVTLNLPPGRRLFAVFGADWVAGDWLTSWTLLDLFLLLIFTLAVFRIWGLGSAGLAFCAFGLAYHEPGAPRYLWLILLVPLALLRVVSAGRAQRLLQFCKWLAALALVFVLVPFIVQQVQYALYPQLENGPEASFQQNESISMASAVVPAASGPEATLDAKEIRLFSRAKAVDGSAAPMVQNSNLLYDTKARIQTGPGVPDWTWRTVSFGWNGPVRATQEVRPILVSLELERVLTILRVTLLLALAGMLLDVRRLRLPLQKVGAGGAVLVLILLLPGWASAEIPDAQTLSTLRERLLKISDAYPHAADIPQATISVQGNRLLIDAEIQTVIRTAVPIPGKIEIWSPLRVSVDGKPEAVLRRDDGFLWVLLEPGVHRVIAEGQIAGGTEWQLTFRLPPRHLTIQAPGWTISGLRPDGTPEAQIFFVLQQKATAGESSYDRQEYQSLVAVERHLELGLSWQVHTAIRRISPLGKAVSLRIPLLPGENITSANLVPREGFLEVRLGAQDAAFVWESELPITKALALVSHGGDSWVESWFLVASPVWNVKISGLPPVFESGNDQLVPTWHPWPGEATALEVSRPEAIAGPTVTVSHGTREITLGKRQRESRLDLTLRCSVGEDFLILLPEEAEVVSLTREGDPIPVRKEGRKLIVPLSPGEQKLSLNWKMNLPLALHAMAETVVLPVPAANLTTTIHLPDDRWILWTHGPQRGPAVRFWGILIAALLGAIALGRLRHSPLKPLEWMLLAIGLTQVPLAAAIAVVAWLFLLAWRGRESFLRQPRWRYNLLQGVLIFMTVVSLGIVIAVVGEGLLGKPEMFIVGNGSSRADLHWYLARSGPALPQPGCVSVSIWWYRFAMLLWALWLATSLIRWLQWGWKQFSTGGIFRSAPVSVPPPMVPVPPVSSEPIPVVETEIPPPLPKRRIRKSRE